MATTKLIRRRFYAATAAAGAIAAVLSVAPLTADRTTTEGAPEAFLNQNEGSGFDHNQAHRAPTAAGDRGGARRPPGVHDGGAGLARSARTRRRAPPPSRPPAPPARSARASRPSPTACGGRSSASPRPRSTPSCSRPARCCTSPSRSTRPRREPTAATPTSGTRRPTPSTAVPPPVVDYPTGPDRPANLWCGGQVQLAGRARPGGGRQPRVPDATAASAPATASRAAKWVMTFDPWTETWTAYQDMAHGRWYPSLVELPDGRVLILGGWDETGGVDNGGASYPPLMVNNKDVEVFDPATPRREPRPRRSSASCRPKAADQPKPWPNHEGLGLYPHLFVLPSTSALGRGRRTRCWSPAPASTTRRSSTPPRGSGRTSSTAPDVGQPRISEDRSWGTRVARPVRRRGSRSGSCCSAAATPAARPPARARPSRRRRPPRRSTSTPPDAGWTLGAGPEPQHRPLALQHGPAARRRDLQQRRRLRPQGRHPLRRAGLPGGAADARARAPGRPWAARRTPAPTTRRRCCCPTAGWHRRATTATSPARLRGPPAVGNRTAQIWSPPYLFDGPRPAVTFAPGAVRLRRDLPRRRRGRPVGDDRARSWSARPPSPTRSTWPSA